MRASVQVLIVDDDRSLRDGCESLLRVDGYNVTTIGRGDEALEVIKRRQFDIILLDLYMTPISGMEILRAAVDAKKDTIVVVMTGNPSVASSLEALRAGAWDYLPKPFSASHVQVLVGRAAHAIVVARETRAMRRSGHPPEEGSALIGNAPAFRRAVELARKVAGTDASVMIYGESGTGKEAIAQLIHRHSRRASRKIVAINCAALPEPLLESEMFGHRKGSFTGADRDKPGLLEIANGGTLFLDELTEMSHPLQAKLLRVLQDGVVRRVGSEGPDAVVDARFVSATNRDPSSAVASGILREDLFYRLRVVQVTLPPLRERPDDILPLATHFLSYYWERHRGNALPRPQLTPGALEFLRSQPWRGNVRELQNAIENMAVLADPGQEIDAEAVLVFCDFGTAGVPGVHSLPPRLLDDSYHPAKDHVVAGFEREYLNRLVARSGGNMSRAARLAGIDRTTLYRLFEKHGLHRHDLRDASD
ncbi:MAG: sigma-54 dependent transcriptional regulator [Gemmatimonadota bacterium]|nr:sigma-54 dependent transcriptional regulator [Gemmatimonadota bacterium]